MIVTLHDMQFELTRKKIKHLHLRIQPPQGEVKVTAPMRTSMDAIHRFVLSKKEWIKQHQHKIQQQSCEMQKEYVDGESHFIFGERYFLRVIDNAAIPMI